MLLVLSYFQWLRFLPEKTGGYCKASLFFYIGEKSVRLCDQIITNRLMNNRNLIQFWFKTKKKPQTPGDLALAKLPLEDPKVKSLKKERDK